MQRKKIGLLAALCLVGCSASNDKLIGSWVEPIPGQVGAMQGVRFDPDGVASSINMHTLLYERWSQDGEYLILTGKSVGNGQTISFTDTMKLSKLTPDSLVLTQGGIELRYGRLQDEK